MTIPAILIKEQPDDERFGERYRVRFGALRVDANTTGFELIVHDVSTAGILVEIDQELELMAQIMVDLPCNIRSQATVIWNKDQFYGLQFSNQMSSRQLRRILSDSPIIWPKFNSEPSPERISYGLSCDGTNNLVVREYDFRTGVEDDDRLSLSTRLKLILGLAIGSWGLIGGAAWLTFA